MAEQRNGTARPRNGRPQVRRIAQAEAKPTPIFDRAPPFDPEAEINVLGAAMLMPQVIDEVLLLLAADDFHDDAHRTIWEAIVSLNETSKGADPALLFDLLTKRGQADAVGGAAYLGKIINAVPHAAHAIYYAEIVAAKATLRRLIDASTEVLREAYADPEDVAGLVTRAESSFAAVSERGLGKSDLMDAATFMVKAMDELDDRLKGDGTLSDRGVATGYVRLDSLLRGGFRNANLVVVAGRPSMGKTALAMNITANACRAGKVVYFQSLEMSYLELAERMLCAEGRVNSHRLANGTISQEDRMRLVTQVGDVSHWPLFIDDVATRTVSQIAAQARRLKRKRGGLDMVVIDYLQLIEPDNSKDPRQEQVAKMCRRLKILARELNVPVVILAQLNRQTEQSRDNRPRLSHLRESGAIEQDADVVLFPHRPGYYCDGDDAKQWEGKAQLIVAKQRNGPTDEIDVAWLKDYTRFENLAERRFEDDAGNPIF